MRCILWALTFTFATQGQAPSAEVRVSSRPYLPSSVVLRVESTLVQVGVVVRNTKGQAIPGLKQTDFRVLDQNRDREVSSFSVDTLSERPAPVPTMRASATNAAAAPADRPATHPRYIAIYFDDYGTPTGDIMRTKVAAKRFVQDGLGAGDLVALFTTSAGRTTEYSADRQLLIDAIDKIQAHPRFSENGLANCPRITPYDAYLIANNMGEYVLQLKMQELNACPGQAPPPPPPPTPKGAPPPPRVDPAREMIVSQSLQTWEQVRAVAVDTLDHIRGAVDDLAQRHGTRMVLLVSSGFLAGTLREQRDRVIDHALHAGVVINSLDAKGLFVEPPGRPDGAPSAPVYVPAPGIVGIPADLYLWESMSKVAAKDVPSEVLAEFAQATGGLFFHHNNDYSFGFRELGSVPEATYLLGFRPSEADADGKYHNLKVRFTSNSGHSGYTIEARPGYFAAPKIAATAMASTPRGRLDAEVSGTDSRVEFPLELAVRVEGGKAVSVRFHVDAAALRFPSKNDRYTQRLTLVAALFDAAGKMVTAKEGAMDLALSDASYRRFLKTGVNATLTLGAAPGAYRVRAVVQEAVDNKIAASGSEVQVP